MCIICVEWELGKLTSKEALRNLGELIVGTKNNKENDHYFEVSEKILDREVPLSDDEKELDRDWVENDCED